MKSGSTETTNVKKILIITDRIAPFFNGGYENALLKFSYFLNENFQVSWLTTYNQSLTNVSHDQQTFLPDNIFWLVSPRKNITFTNKRYVHSIRGIISYNFYLRHNKVLNRKFDLVIVNSIPYIGVSGVMKKILKGGSIITVIFHEAWYNYPDGLFNYLYRKLIRSSIFKIVNRTNHIIAISDNTKESLITNYNVPDSKICLVPLGTDLVEKSDNNSLRDIDVLYIGRLSKIKRIPDIIDAIYKLNNKGRTIKVVIVGEGPLKPKLETYVDKLELSKLIEFTGYVNDINKKEILKRSKIFLMPSEREGFSIATLEAMSYGVVPIVAKPFYEEVYGIGQFLRDKFNGITYPVGNVDFLSFALDNLLNDHEYRKKLSKNAVETANGLTWDKSASLLHDCVQQIFNEEDE